VTPTPEPKLIDTGRRDVKPVVVVHGGPGESHASLRPHLDGLAPRVVYYDQRKGPAGWKEHVADLDAVRRELSLDALTLCGFSWGALLSLLYALEHPSRVARTVLISPPAVYTGAPEPKLPPPGAALLALQTRLAGGGPAAQFALKIAPFFADPAKATRVTPVEVDDAAAAAVWTSLRGFDLRPRLGALKLAALVIRGEQDPLPVAYAELVASLLGAKLTSIPAAGHAPFVEAPEAFLRAVQPFLEGL
jgi:proline iminopeptidase